MWASRSARSRYFWPSHQSSQLTSAAVEPTDHDDDEQLPQVPCRHPVSQFAGGQARA
jgi:hypothetical protein